MQRKNPQLLAVGVIDDQFMPEMLQRFSEGKRRKNTDKLAVETVRGAKGAPWKAMENDGKRTIRARNVGRKSGQEHKVSGSWNRQPKSIRSKWNAAMILIVRTEL